MAGRRGNGGPDWGNIDWANFDLRQLGGRQTRTPRPPGRRGVAVTVLIVLDSLPSLRRFGLDFLVTSRWDPVHAVFGAGAYLFGTLVTTAIICAV